MLTEPMTLYKLMNLYMLKQVNFPLTNAQLTNFFTEHEYTTYFTLQQALNELEDAGLVHKEASHNSTRYDITREGEETLNFFGKNISSAIIEDMNQYLKENKFRLREEVGTTADFYKGTNQDVKDFFWFFGKPEKADCENDSYEEILRKWGDPIRTEHFAKKLAVYRQIEEYAAQ